VALILAPTVELFGQTRARQFRKNRDPIRHETRIAAAPERRGRAQRQKMRQHVARLAHKVDTQIVVRNPDMDVHAANDEPARYTLKIAGKDFIALL
jgi:hypothetical protein